MQHTATPRPIAFFQALSSRSNRRLLLAILSAALVCDGPLAKRAGETLVAYDGERRPPGEVVTLRLEEADWVEIGELRVERDHHVAVELTPGEHSIKWGAAFGTSFLVNPKMRIKDDFEATVTLEAGHTYELYADRTYGQGYQTFFWIEDVETEDVVAGRKIPSRMTPEQAKMEMFGDEEIARFFEASSAGDVSTVRSMLDEGFEVDARDEQNATALIWASSENRVEVIDLLLDRGADPNAALEPPHGSTALMVAAAMGLEGSIGHLLAYPETDVNARGVFRQTALMYAATNKHTDIVILLLEHGAELNARDAHGKTALDWARGGKTKTLLRDAGAKKGKEL